MSDTHEVVLHNGEIALIDAEDWPEVSRHKWHCQISKSGAHYAYANIRVDGKRKCIGLHQFVMGIVLPLTVDHIDHNTLDCRKANLRIATPTQQNANRRISKNNKSGYKGVFFYGNRYRVNVQTRWVRGAAYHTAEEAARAYDRIAKERFGEFAVLNFPE